jgi:hypothetical protein
MVGIPRHLQQISLQVPLSSSALERRKSLTFLFICLLLLLVGCASIPSALSRSTDTRQTTTPHEAHVSFAPVTTYENALRLITDLGLQPVNPCIGTSADLHGVIHSWSRWSPIVDEHLFSLAHAMWIASTPSTPSDWEDRLKVQHDVMEVKTDFNIMCPAMLGTPPPGTIIALTSTQAGNYARIAFILRGDQYQQALSIVSSLGLRLADPCYEQAKNTSVRWYSMGQETSFAKTRTLLVATTEVSPDNWQRQLYTSAAVASIQVLFAVRC